jgi:dTDP-4-dehydrorhamnose 3,5-epimerase
MRFHATPLSGCYTVELEKRMDSRGFFARVFCAEEFTRERLESRFVQMNTSLSLRRGTLRGMHYQVSPAEEAKLVRCLTGALYDVVLDLRPDSPSHGQWFGAELDADNRRMMYVPKGCAHGFLTLEDNTEVLYLVSAFYAPESERGVRYDDPRFGIRWPFSPTEMSDKDRTWPYYRGRD